MSDMKGNQHVFPHDVFSSPHGVVCNCGTVEIHRGLTKRELYAAVSLMGLLNNAESRIFPMKHQEDKSNAEILAENSFFMADAMLKEGSK